MIAVTGKNNDQSKQKQVLQFHQSGLDDYEVSIGVGASSAAMVITEKQMKNLHEKIGRYLDI